MAKKTYEANRMKTSHRSRRSPSPSGSILPSPLRPSYNPNASTDSLSALSVTEYASSPNRQRPHTVSMSNSKTDQGDVHFPDSPTNHGSLMGLAERGLTDAAKLRKMTLEAMMKTRKKDRTSTIGVPSDTNYFMPKVEKLRPDGASLTTVYEAKQRDYWGKIIKGQYIEDEHKKFQDRLKKEHNNEEYSKRLTEQVSAKLEEKRIEREREKKLAGFTPGGMFEVIDEKQKQRDKIALVNHKKYIADAVHDIDIKIKQKDEYLREELEAAAYLIRASEYQAELERQKQQKKRDFQKKLTETLYQENVVLIAERERKKQEKFLADRAYVKETDAKFEREEKARVDEVAKRFKRAAVDGPASQTTLMIKMAAAKSTEDTFERLRLAENSLNKQLKATEEATHAKELFRKTALLGEYDKVLEKHRHLEEQSQQEKKKAHDDMIAFQRKYAEDSVADREKRRQAAARYQHMLNDQLSDLRGASLNSLQETMTEKERKFNADLIRKFLN